jgi:uncharacterized membrane protein
MNRFKSKAAWVAVFALVGFFLGNYGLYAKIGLTDESYQTMVNLLLAVLAAFGIFNNPTDSQNF